MAALGDDLPLDGAPVLRRGEPGYEPARRASLWARNLPARRPDLIVQARTVDDVVAVVRHAAAAGAPVAIKGSGHNYAGTFLRDGGVMLDVSALDGAALDGETAHVGPGIASATLARFLAERGRAFPTGHHATVGIGGFLLGGGMGFNGRSWGEYACFGVEAVDVVCADGELRTIDAERDPDLFWAARGAGAGFPAVAVGFRLATRPLPRGMHAAGWTYPLGAARAVAEWLQRDADAGRPDLERFAAFEGDVDGAGDARRVGEGAPGTSLAPAAGAAGPTAARGLQSRPPLCRVRAIAFHDDPDEARAALRDLAAAAPPGALEQVGPLPIDFPRLYARGGITGERLRVVSDTIWSDDPVGAAAALAERVAAAPDRRSFGMVDFRTAPELPHDAAASVAARGFLSWAAKWDDPAADDRNGDWADATTAAMEPFRAGCYLNETDVLRHPERAPHCFSAEAWERLRAVRERYDPAGRFPPPW
ncbi:FAD-binding protein [Conexibacter arvalis]|uniref:FAD/FMN-containing dehydrogenase n=1 Tax=Conexibacter arvalis TaxID=912552 RepID=A0A840I925_9ACTN|nr:FAD-binding protein [Conexibacter arvalis]MBB4661366.1 FAD/FMN-containing dehydrogenase [Conexibacter arvalis]